MTSSNKSKSELYEMVVRGTEFKDDYEFEMYGEETTAILQPLVDDEFLPIAAFLSNHLEMDEGDEEEAVSEAIDKVDEAREAPEELEDIEGIGDSMAEALREAGFTQPKDVASADPDTLADEVENVGPALAERMQEDAEEALEEPVDISQLDEEFVKWMQNAAKLGIYGSYDEDGNEIEYDDEEIEFMVDNMMGGYSVEIGGRVLEISGDVRDAEKFRGGRGRVKRSRDS